MMPGINIRPLKPSDLEQLNDLHKTRDDGGIEGKAEKRTKLVEWFAFHNPFSNGEATYYVAEDSGRLVALEGRMPLDFCFRGRTIRGYYVHDTFVHPSYRAKGIGFKLILSFAETIEKESDSFFCVFGGTPLNLRIHRRMGYHEAPAAPKFMKILRLTRGAAEALKLPRFVVPFAPLISGVISLVDLFVMAWRRPSLRAIPLERFGPQCDELMSDLCGKLGISSLKRADYLNWKYVDGPARVPEILAVEKNGRIAGFVVLASVQRGEMKEGLIMEFVADPSDRETTSALCRGTVEYFRRANAHVISSVNSDRRFSAVLKRFAFFEGGTGIVILLGNLDKVSPDEKRIIIDTAQWHITLGESDAFMIPLRFV